MFQERTERVENVEQGIVPIDEVKIELRERSGRIHWLVWQEHFADMEMPLLEYWESNNLPLIDSFVEGMARHVTGNDVIQSFLSRSGVIFEKLVHFESDGLDYNRSLPNEVIGEASEKVYRDSYSKANLLLDFLEQEVKNRGLATLV